MKTLLYKSLIILVLFFAAGSIVTSAGLVNRASAKEHKDHGNVNACQVRKYLEEMGYYNVDVIEELENGNWTATGWMGGSIRHILVYVEGGQIIGHEEFPQ